MIFYLNNRVRVNSESTFPFEGNWNNCLPLPFKVFSTSLNPLSRLKGIETAVFINFIFQIPYLWIHFPVWRELKRKHWLVLFVFQLHVSESTFPFEGNWNTIRLAKRILIPLCSESTFPFEGNWNTSRIARTLYSQEELWIHFPVWRELKPIFFQFPNKPCHSESTFPFEGNWNFLCLCWERKNYPTLNPLSRLKGIETASSACFCGRGRHSESTFPFEGNWNRLQRPGAALVWALWIHFPVWRELKLC